MMPLEGIRVLDLTRQAPGPYCTMLLGDLGADVIVVEEPPGAGRRMDMGMSERTQAFWALSRNKRSVALNLKEPSAVEAFLKMAEKADVVIEGFRPGVVKRLGVDYDAVKARNERAIYCSLSGYGQTGPYAGLVGHDINYISIGGALGLTGTGEPGSPPAIPMNVIADFAGGGLYAAFSILAAVIARADDRPRPVRRHRDERRRHLAARLPRQPALRRRSGAEARRRDAERRRPLLRRLRVLRRQVALHRLHRALVLGGDCARRSASRSSSPTR